MEQKREREGRIEELRALKEIAETLNSSHDMKEMLEAVLRKLLEVTGLHTGWVFLMEEEPTYLHVTDVNLPPALSWEDKKPMRCGSCWCVDKYWGGRLQNAVNIINCKRIDDAIENNWGDTQCIYHHATVPLKASGEWFGLLNVASPGKTLFTDEELALLESVAFQIGTAIKRTKLYQEQQQRASYYNKLGDIVMQLGHVQELNKIPSEAVKRVGENFPWLAVAYFAQEADSLSCRAYYADQQLVNEWRMIRGQESGLVREAMQKGKLFKKTSITQPLPALLAMGLPAYQSAMAVPLKQRGQTLGALLVISDKKDGFAENDQEILLALSEHISITVENARLNQQRNELGRWEERNRLARDLHDSVCQNLFSLSLLSRGLESFLQGPEPAVSQTLEEIQQLTEDSLKEMRSLIWQLRPAGLEQGLVTALRTYGEKLGLTIIGNPEKLYELPRTIEETLWRIGQEALNNVSKHAGVNEVKIVLQVTNSRVQMEIRDKGKGFPMSNQGRIDSLGLVSMRERSEMLGGLFQLESTPERGTTVRVSIPFY